MCRHKDAPVLALLHTARLNRYLVKEIEHYHRFSDNARLLPVVPTSLDILVLPPLQYIVVVQVIRQIIVPGSTQALGRLEVLAMDSGADSAVTIPS